MFNKPTKFARWIALLIALSGTAAFAQTGISNGYCDVGAVPALTSGLKSTNTLLGVIPYCTITAYLHGTETLATLYSDSSGTPLTNPFTATNTGFWQFYAANNATYDVFGSGGIAPNTYPAPTLIPGGGGSGGGGSSAPQFSVQFALNALGAFGSDPSITINPTAHIFQAPEVYVPGSGSGIIGLTDSTSSNTVWQSVQPGSSTWHWYWPMTAPSNTNQCMFGNPTGLGSWRYCVPGVDVTEFSGSDVGAQVNAARAGCSNQCQLYIPAGTYSFSTSISLPLNQFSQFSLVLDPGAVLSYTGTGDAITLPVAGAGPTEGNCRISGGSLYGNAGAKSGIHLWPTNTCNIQNMLIASFSAGYGIWVDGANMVNIDHNIIFGNDVGVYLTNTFCNGATCNDMGTGAPYTPNAIYIAQNGIFSNSEWGVESFSPQTGNNTGPANDVIADNDLELNGSAGTAYGAVTFGRSRNLVIRENYFEGSPLGIVLGIPGGSDGSTRFFASIGPIIRDNYFTLEDTQNPSGSYSINLLDSADAIIEGNSTLGASENTNSCFVNSLALAGSNIGETGTYLGKNHWEADINTGQGNYTCVAGVSSVLLGVGSFPILNTNYIPYLAYYNFAANATVTTENIAIQYLTTNGGTCFLYPISANARTSFAAQTSYLDPITVANQVTFVHPAMAGMNFNIYCNRSIQ